MLALCALLALGLAGCGGDEPAPVATPPAPAPVAPPFQAEAVEVALGDNGGTVTLMTTEAGGFTLNGEAFTGGDESPVEGEGGRTYVLTLAEGTWSAAFQPMEVMVPLGESGDSATLMTTEAGGYAMDGAAFESGGMATSTEGARYTLTMDAEGMWMAMFMPMTQTVTLGTSDNTVELMTNEAGVWMLGEMELADDSSYTHMVGDRNYTLAMDDEGMWTATFMPMTQTVTLGMSGDTVTLTSTEGGDWALGGSLVLDGYVATAENDNRYRLTMDDDGMWMAAFIATPQVVDLGGSLETVRVMTTEAGGWAFEDGTDVEDGGVTQNSFGQTYRLSVSDAGEWSAAHEPTMQSVRLGTSGMSVELATDEQGRWMQGEASVASGDRVEGAENAATGAANEYELTLTSGTWSAAYRPMTMVIADTGLTASAREDGRGYDVGDLTLPASGMGEITAPDGAMYRVAKDDDGMLAGTRFDMPIVGTAMHTNAVGTHGRPTLSTDDPETDADETGTMLNAVGGSLSMADLLGSGRAVAMGPNLVSDARDALVKIRERVEGLVELREADGITADDFTMQINRQWNAADVLVNDLFGQGTKFETPGTDGAYPNGLLERATSVNRVVEGFDRVIAALSTEEALVAATKKAGPDRLLGLPERTEAQAKAAFNRVKWTATGTLGALGSTRFGAAVYNETAHAAAGPGDADRAQGFAWSTMASTMRASDVQTAGNGYYAGVTHAANQEGTLYQGTMEITVNFAARDVDGLVRGLAEANTGEAWSFGLGGDVSYIALPRASLERRGSWRVRTGRGEGRIAYVPGVGSRTDTTYQGGRFSGRLLGRGDEAGTEVIGTWRVALEDGTGEEILAGGFGAQRVERLDPNAALIGNLSKVGGSAANPASVWLTDSSAPPEILPGSTKLEISSDSLGGSAVEQYEVELTLPETTTTVLGGRLTFVPWTRYGIEGSLDYYRGCRNPPCNNLNVIRTGEDPEGIWVLVPVSVRDTARPIVITTTDAVGPDADVGEVRIRTRDGYVNFEAQNVFELDRAKLFAGEYPVTSTDDVALAAQQEVIKSTHVSEVRAEVIKQRARLQQLISLGDVDATFANDRRQEVFSAIQGEMRKIFGPDIAELRAGLFNDGVLTPGAGPVVFPGLSTGVLTPDSGAVDTPQAIADKWTAWLNYPVNSSNDPQDREVLAEIDDIVAALENVEAFEAAFDSGGVFAGQSANPVVASQAVSSIYTRPKSRLLLQTGTTDFTRFGSWRKQESPFAGAGLIDSSDPDSRPFGGIGAFAYSPVAPTRAYEAADQPQYPASGSTNVLARYVGSTVAAQNNQFYQGSVEARVEWNAAEVGGQVRVKVSDLRSTNPAFGALQFGRVDLVNSAVLPEVKSVTFAGEIANYGSDRSVLGFSSNLDNVSVELDTVEGRLVQGGARALQRSYNASNGRFFFKPSEGADLVVTWAPRFSGFDVAELNDIELYTDVPLISAPASPEGNLARLHRAQLNLEVPVAMNNYGSGELSFIYLDGSEEFWTITSNPTAPSSVSHSDLTGELSGRFIGNTPSGPVGMLGTWQLNVFSELFGVGEERGPIQGAFGAELAP